MYLLMDTPSPLEMGQLTPPQHLPFDAADKTILNPTHEIKTIKNNIKLFKNAYYYLSK